jgi:predicted nucleic acid-binding protein
VKVLVDTSVWSLSLRRSPEKRSASENVLTAHLTDLIADGRAALIGPIRQEILTGIRTSQVFTNVRRTLRSFPDEPLETSDFELAAEFANQCLSAGVASGPVDILICAVAKRRSWSVCTTDQDFVRYSEILDLVLDKPA